MPIPTHASTWWGYNIDINQSDRTDHLNHYGLRHGVTSIIIGSMLLEQGRADVALCGAVDFALVEPILAGFATMGGAYRSVPGGEPEPACRSSRPFSVDRRGFVFPKEPAASLLQPGNLPTHTGCLIFLRSPDGDDLGCASFCRSAAGNRCALYGGMYRKRRGVPGDIDAVNAHAASTKVGDSIEYQALENGF